MPGKPASLDQIVHQARGLYTLPAVAVQVLELTGNPELDTRALKECIENDPALSAKILRVVNSSLMGLSQEVRDLNQALALLGTKPLKLLVLGFSLPERLFGDVEEDVLGRYWRETLTKAVACREMAQQLWAVPGDEAFMAGLLHDIGVLVLIKQIGKPYLEFLERTAHENGNRAQLELDALGFHHTTLSAHLLDHWGLPKSLTNAIAAPKSLRELRRLSEPEWRVARILHLADLLVQLVVEHRINVLPDLLEAGEVYCRVTKGQINRMVESLQASVDTLADVLSLQLPTGRDYREVLLESQERMSELSTLVVEDSIEQNQVARGAHGAAPEAPLLALPQNDTSSRLGCTTSAEPTCTPPRGGTAVAEPSRSKEKLPADPNSELVKRLTRAAAHCRSRRTALSLLVFEIDDYDDLVRAHGAETANDIAESARVVCCQLDHESVDLIRLSKVRFAIIVHPCDRDLVVDLARNLLRRVTAWICANGYPPVTGSIGAATASLVQKNPPVDDLIDSANRCLYAAQTGGGNAVKSIEIY